MTKTTTRSKPTPAQLYSQELAQYTLRQFSSANAVLDESKKARLAKIPSSWAHVKKAERMIYGSPLVSVDILIPSCSLSRKVNVCRLVVSTTDLALSKPGDIFNAIED